MTELYVDPDGLTAVAEVARRQHDHVGKVSDYIATTCSRFGAFSGVLNLFEGSYRSAVSSALEGMQDGQTIATKMQTTVTACRRDYLETDHEVYDAFKKLFGTQEGFPPYVAPGGGDSSPAGPLQGPPKSGDDPADDEPFKLPGLPPWLSGPADRMFPGPDTGDLPPGMDPQEWLKNHVTDSVHQHQLEQSYLEHRAAGMTPSEALDAARHDLRDAGQVATDHADATQRQRTEDAYDTAHDRAVAGGATPEEARQAGQDAAQEQHHADSQDRHRRDDIGSTAGTLHSGYTTVADTVSNVQSIIDHAQQLDETTSDLGDYDDYEDGGRDHSAQDWGQR